MPEILGAPRAHDGGSRRDGAAGRDGALYAALDLGTNNCRLLIARPVRGGFRVADSFSRIVRLGEGLSRTGRLDDEAMDRAYEALALCAERLARRGVDARRVSAVATQACRIAENGPAFIERVRTGTGLALRIISPSEEAQLSVVGCRNLFDPEARAILVMDVGGGSTELSWLRRNGDRFETAAWLSMPVGVVTLAERHPEPQGGPDAWFEAMIADVQTHLAEARVDVDIAEHFRAGRAHMVGTSGAITSLAGVHLALPRYSREHVDGLWLSREACTEATNRLRAMNQAQRAAEGCIGPERADLVLAGAAILEAVLRVWPSARLRVADRGLREGLLLDQMRRDRRRRRR